MNEKETWVQRHPWRRSFVIKVMRFVSLSGVDRYPKKVAERMAR